jgi:PEGA domain
VGIQDGRTGRQASDPSRRASLQVELRVPEKQMLVTFREAFLKWLTDRTGPLGRALGLGERFSLDEQQGADVPGVSTLRLTVTWSVAHSTVRAASPWLRPARDRRTDPAGRMPPDNFVFVPSSALADAPRHPELLDLVGESVPAPYPRLPQPRRTRPIGVRVGKAVAAAMAVVREQSARALQRLTASATSAAAAARGIVTAVNIHEPGNASRLSVRFPTLATHPRVWALGAFGSAVVATGFAVGALHLGTGNRVTPDRSSSPAAAALATSGAVSVPPVEAATAAPGPAGIAPPAPTAPLQVSPPAQPAAARPETGSRGGSSRVRAPAAARRDAPAARASRVTEVATTGSTKSGRIKITKGALLVKSDPQGAEVSINGIVLGRTPLMIRDLGAGSRVVRLELPGYERWSWAVAVVANKRTPVNVKLRRDVRRVSNPD